MLRLSILFAFLARPDHRVADAKLSELNDEKESHRYCAAEETHAFMRVSSAAPRISAEGATEP
jgi:hypothetical protein